MTAIGFLLLWAAISLGVLTGHLAHEIVMYEILKVRDK